MSTARIKLSLVETTPALRNQYRIFRKLGFSRHDVNMMMVGAAAASGHARLEVGDPPVDLLEEPQKP